jgi:DMSO reductase anchor subunit
MVAMRETDYQRAWRERGEVEAALRKWNNNQSSPIFLKSVAIVGGLVGAAIVVGFIKEPSWTYVPVLFIAALFLSLLFLTPSMLRDEVKARAEAKETLERLGYWEEDK